MDEKSDDFAHWSEMVAGLLVPGSLHFRPPVLTGSCLFTLAAQRLACSGFGGSCLSHGKRAWYLG